MKLLLDQGLPRSALGLLREAGIDAVHVAEIGYSTIDNPFEGWTEARPGMDARVPFFGSIPQVIELGIQRKAVDAEEGIGQSYFGWVGNRYKAIGLPAAQETERWWRSLNRWVKLNAATKITPWGPLDGSEARVWAFPSAYRQILSGKHRDANPAVGQGRLLPRV